MKDSKLQIDVGSGILTIESSVVRDTIIVTAYINGISLRCSTLHLARIASAFVDSVVSACQVSDDEPHVTVESIGDEIEAFIDSALQ
jgi:hypothetical protein